MIVVVEFSISLPSLSIVLCKRLRFGAEGLGDRWGEDLLPLLIDEREGDTAVVVEVVVDLFFTVPTFSSMSIIHGLLYLR